MSEDGQGNCSPTVIPPELPAEPDDPSEPWLPEEPDDPWLPDELSEPSLPEEPEDPWEPWLPEEPDELEELEELEELLCDPLLLEELEELGCDCGVEQPARKPARINARTRVKRFMMPPSPARSRISR